MIHITGTILLSIFSSSQAVDAECGYGIADRGVFPGRGKVREGHRGKLAPEALGERRQVIPHVAALPEKDRGDANRGTSHCRQVSHRGREVRTHYLKKG